MAQGSLADRRARIVDSFTDGDAEARAWKGSLRLSNWKEDSAESEGLVNVYNLRRVKMFCH